MINVDGEIEWGRVPRGRVWHLLVDGSTALCGPCLYVEATKGMPPMGARVCDRCAAAGRNIAAVITAAVTQNDLPTTLDPTPDKV